MRIHYFLYSLQHVVRKKQENIHKITCVQGEISSAFSDRNATGETKHCSWSHWVSTTLVPGNVHIDYRVSQHYITEVYGKIRIKVHLNRPEILNRHLIGVSII